MIGGGLLVFGRLLSAWLLEREDYAHIFQLLAVFALLFALNGLVMAILNGVKEIGRLIAVNITTSMVILVLSVLLVRYAGLEGALLALAIGPGIVLFFTLAIVGKCRWFRWESFRRPADRAMARRLGQYTLMGATTAVSLPVSQILIRDHLAAVASWDAAGYWQGLWQISDGYLLVITTALSTYYLPRLSELDDPAEIRREIRAGYRFLLPVTAAGAVLIYLMREPIVLLLFSEAFLPMCDIFAFQLIGDVLKIASWLMSYIMVAKALTRRFVLTELFFSASFIVLSFVLVDHFGLIGVTYAFALNYLGYLLTMAWAFRRDVGLVRMPVEAGP